MKNIEKIDLKYIDFSQRNCFWNRYIA